MSERKDGFMAFEIDDYGLQAAAQKVWEEDGHDGHYSDLACVPEVYEDIARPIILAYLTELEGPPVWKVGDKLTSSRALPKGAAVVDETDTVWAHNGEGYFSAAGSTRAVKLENYCRPTIIFLPEKK